MTVGLVVREYWPWLVVQQPDGRHVVVDDSAEPPAQVYGPNSRSNCEAYCRASQQILAAVGLLGSGLPPVPSS